MGVFMARRWALFLLLVSCHTDTKIKTNMGADALPQPYVEWDIYGDVFSREKNVTLHWKSGGYRIEQFSVDAYLAANKECQESLKRPTNIAPNSVTFEELPEGIFHLCLNATIQSKIIHSQNNGARLIIDFTAPVFTSLSLSNEAADKTVTYDDILLDKALVSPVVASGQDHITYDIAAAGTDCSTLTPFNKESIPTAGLLARYDNGDYKICVRLSDNAGNKTFGASEVFALHSKAPATGTASFTVSNIETNRLKLEWTAAKDSVTPVAKLKYFIYRSTLAPFDTISRVEMGTLLNPGGTLDLTSFQVEDLVESSTYFFNVIVENEQGYKSLYEELEARTQVRAGSSWIDLATGAKHHQCALSDDRKAYCWGANDAGQLGIGSTGGMIHKPTLVTGNLAFLEIHAGDQRSCGLTVSGELYCWGTDSNVPVKAATERFKQIAMGVEHSCALRSDGDLFCWGSDTQGQQANGAGVTPNTSPTATASGMKFRTIRAAHMHTCGINDAGLTYCWGDSMHTPTLVSATERFRELAVGAFINCGINESGKVSCWGKNASGAVGIGTTGADEIAPVAIQSTENFRTLAIADESVCGITAAGATYCWGVNDKGQLGLGDTNNRSAPTWVNHNQNYVKIAATAQSFCGLTTLGNAWCWGSDEQEQLGNAALSGNKLLPSALDMSQVTGEARFISMLAGGWSSCGLTSQGNALCTGAYADGILGYGGAVSGPAPRPVAVPTHQKLRGLTNGYDHQCALNTQGQAYCWGNNESGQMGIASTSEKEIYPRAVSLPNGDAFIQVAAGRGSTCGLVSDGRVFCWGSDEFGQLGNAEPKEDKNVPVALDTALKFVSIAAGENHHCALTQEGAAYCWGRNDKKQLGDGTSTDSASPKLVGGAHHFLSITAGKNHTCGGAADGVSYCWGSDNVGQSGNGDSITGLQSDPIALDSTEIFRSVITGYSFTCGVSNAGTPYCWGSNSWGRLGKGAMDGFEASPYAVASSDTFVSISAGYAHACALSQRNQAVCWGHDGFEQLGDGLGATDVTAPGAWMSLSE